MSKYGLTTTDTEVFLNTLVNEPRRTNFEQRASYNEGWGQIHAGEVLRGREMQYALGLCEKSTYELKWF